MRLLFFLFFAAHLYVSSAQCVVVTEPPIYFCKCDTTLFTLQCDGTVASLDSVVWGFGSEPVNQPRILYDTLGGVAIQVVFIDTTWRFFFPTFGAFYWYTDNMGNKKFSTYTSATKVDICPIEQAAFESSEREVCEGACIDFINKTHRCPDRAAWYFEGGSPAISTDMNPTGICYTQAGLYDVKLIVHNEISSDTVVYEDYIRVLPLPDLVSSMEQSVGAIIGDTLRLQACAEGQAYLWSPPDGLSCTDCPDPVLIVTGLNTRYTCTVFGDGSVCDVTCNYRLLTENQSIVYLPNVFSPNEDGDNDEMRAYGPLARIRLYQVYDRWGGLVFSTDNPDGAWDGTDNGKPASLGVYTCVIWYTDTRNGTEQMAAWSAALVR